MAEEDPQQAAPGAWSLPGLLPGLQGAEAGALQLRIKNSICKSIQSKVENILQDVEKFSDIEKLYLYLKLPTGPSSCADKSEQSALSSSRTQQMHAFGWIRDHLEEYPETSLPKQEVYDEYKSFCDNLNYHPLTAADFGKMMKNVFPNMKARRLGMRGKSKYCYSGLRKRPFVQMPSLPALDHKAADGLHSDALDSPSQMSSIKQEVRFAACDLVCEWAQKVLKRQFDTVEDLARFLIDSHYISNKSLAALTLMTGTATEVKPAQAVSAFAPTSEAHCFQPQVKMFSSPSVDAKQQLQKKIQRRQQEQKLNSPLLSDEQTKRTEDGVPCGSPTTPSPQPTIGIVVTAVPSPITVQKSRQLMSESPVGKLESKVLPINFQMVTQPIQAVKQSPRPAQNQTSPVGERTVRQRYAQILPKPSVTSAVTLHSPSAMIISNSPMKTVMTTCHVSPVSLVKMTAISLEPNSSQTTSLGNTGVQPGLAGMASAGVADVSAPQSVRNTSTANILAPPAGPGQVTDTENLDVEMEIEAIHKNSQMQNPHNRVLPQIANKPGCVVQRAASVPIPQAKGFLGLEETSNTRSRVNFSSGANTVAESSNNGSNKAITLHLSLPSQNTSTVSAANTSRLSSFREGIQTEEVSSSTKSLRKRSGLSPDLSPVKRFFMTQQPAGGAAAPDTGNMAAYDGQPFTSSRPESAPAARELEKKISSAMCSSVHTQCTSLFDSHGSIQRKTPSALIETVTAIRDTSLQEQRGSSLATLHAVPANPDFLKHQDLGSNSTAGSLEGARQLPYAPPNPATESLQFLKQASSSQIHMQDHLDYFPFDDDVTQDSIVEELVQMEEQIKLKRLQELGSCPSLQAQQTAMPRSVASASQAMALYYHTATPTPTSEMMGGVHTQAAESPCSRIASTTPVDSALGSSRHTSAGTPHSNCSSTIPPSPVECRNPFAFTPINSSMTGFHDSSPVSSSPVKPMQRPTATHPDKARLEWMSNSYGCSGGGNSSKPSSGILSGYRDLIDECFQKPHAFAVPHTRHHDGHCGRLTPISPVQQQAGGMSTPSRQEGFAVPAPLDSKTTNSSAAAFRCRSVSPAVHQRNLAGSMGGSTLPSVPRSVLSPFNSPVTPEVFSILANSQTNLGASSLAQRSRSVPLNIMMQTDVLSTPGQLCNSSNLSGILLNKLEGNDNDDTFRGLGIHNLASTYTARMNLTQILESKSNLPCSDPHLSLMSSDSTSTGGSQQPNYLMEHTANEQMSLSAGNSQAEDNQQQLDLSGTRPLLSAGAHLMPQGPDGDFPCEIRMTSELSGSINDLNALDRNLLFDPSQQQSKYPNAAAEELMSESLFQQMSETPHSGGLDWLESKDHPTVGLLG